MSVLWKLWYYVPMMISRWWRFNRDYWNFKGLISWSTNNINPAPIYDLNQKPQLLLVLQNTDMKPLKTCGPIVFSFLFLTLILCFALLYFCVAQSEKHSFWMNIGAIKFFRKRTAWNIYLYVFDYQWGKRECTIFTHFATNKRPFINKHQKRPKCLVVYYEMDFMVDDHWFYRISIAHS